MSTVGKWIIRLFAAVGVLATVAALGFALTGISAREDPPRDGRSAPSWAMRAASTTIHPVPSETLFESKTSTLTLGTSRVASTAD